MGRPSTSSARRRLESGLPETKGKEFEVLTAEMPHRAPGFSLWILAGIVVVVAMLGHLLGLY